MQKDYITIYITDIIPNLSLDSPFYNLISNDDEIVIFNWDFLKDDNLNSKIDVCQEKLLKFINQYENQNIKIAIDGFSSFIYFLIESQITANIVFTYIINPFDKKLFLHTFDIKQKFLPYTIKLTIYKYIYLFNNLDGFRENEKWIKAINNENIYFKQANILYHKIIDQILTYKQIKQYHNWINKLSNARIIVGSKNPFIKINLLTCKQNQLKVIENVGYCIHWEEPRWLYICLKDKNIDVN